MGTIGYTYGSEWHLLRYMGYHRDYLNRQVEIAIPGSEVLDWQDCHFFERPVANLLPPVILEPRLLDAELTGIQFLPEDQQAALLPRWQAFWPQAGNPPNWDAVGRINLSGETHWMIVEAKAHRGELRGSCQAQGPSLAQIQGAFEQTKAGWNDLPFENWMGPYYQFCNRLAFLHFLLANSIRAKLLFIYFLGDRHPPRRGVICPANQAGWAASIEQMKQHVGWVEGTNHLHEHVHELFLPVCPPPGQVV